MTKKSNLHPTFIIRYAVCPPHSTAEKADPHFNAKRFDITPLRNHSRLTGKCRLCTEHEIKAPDFQLSVALPTVAWRRHECQL